MIKIKVNTKYTLVVQEVAVQGGTWVNWLNGGQKNMAAPLI